MADFVWPAKVLVPATAGPPKLVAMNTSGGRSIVGSEQIVGNSAGYWTMAYSAIRITQPDHVLLWNSLQAGLCGRSKTALVSILDYSRAPFPIIDGEKVFSFGNLPFADQALFDDHTGFDQPVIVTQAVGDIPAGAVTANISVIRGDAIQAGHHFAVGERLYRVTKMNSVDRSGDYPVYAVNFMPPAREDIPDTTSLDFDRPAFRCRLATDGEMDVTLDLWKFGNSPTVNFVED